DVVEDEWGCHDSPALVLEAGAGAGIVKRAASTSYRPGVRPLRSNGAEERDSDGRSRPPMKLATLRPAGLNNRGRPDLRSMNTDRRKTAQFVFMDSGLPRFARTPE